MNFGSQFHPLYLQFSTWKNTCQMFYDELQYITKWEIDGYIWHTFVVRIMTHTLITIFMFVVNLVHSNIPLYKNISKAGSRLWEQHSKWGINDIDYTFLVQFVLRFSYESYNSASNEMKVVLCISLIYISCSDFSKCIYIYSKKIIKYLKSRIDNKQCYWKSI